MPAKNKNVRRITQKNLDEVCKNYLGVEMNMNVTPKNPEGEQLTLRDLLVECILCPDVERTGIDRIVGIELAKKFLPNGGTFELTGAEGKLIQERSDVSKFLAMNDWLYGIVHDFVKG